MPQIFLRRPRGSPTATRAPPAHKACPLWRLRRSKPGRECRSVLLLRDIRARSPNQRRRLSVRYPRRWRARRPSRHYGSCRPAGYTPGVFSAFPLMSQSATSTAAMAHIVTGPRRQYAPRYRYCQMSSDLKRIAPDEAGNNVLGKIADDGKLAPVQRPVSEAIDAFVGFYLQSYEVPPRRTNDYGGIGDLHSDGP